MPIQPNPRNHEFDSTPHQPEASLFMRPCVEAKASLKLLAIALVTGEAGNDFPHLDVAAAAARLAPERRGVDHGAGSMPCSTSRQAPTRPSWSAFLLDSRACGPILWVRTTRGAVVYPASAGSPYICSPVPSGTSTTAP